MSTLRVQKVGNLDRPPKTLNLLIDSQIPNVRPTYEEAIAEYSDKLELRGEE